VQHLETRVTLTRRKHQVHLMNQATVVYPVTPVTRKAGEKHPGRRRGIPGWFSTPISSGR
jgi:hypothetical protein